MVISMMAGQVFASPGITGGQALEMMPDARSAAMGETFCGIADNIYALSYNPAGLAVIDHTQIPFASNQWFEGVSQQFAGIAYSLRDIRSSNIAKLGTIALAYNEIDYGGIDGRNAAGLATGSFDPQDRVGILGYAKPLYETPEAGSIMAGVSAKFLEEEITDTKTRTVLFDGGLLWQMPDRHTSLGAAVQNMGQKFKYATGNFSRPDMLRGGLSYRQNDEWLVGIDVNAPAYKDTYYSVGGEFWFVKAIAFRLGYASGKDEESGVSMGVGISVKQVDAFFFFAREFTVDYSYTPYGDLGSLQRVSLMLKLGTD